MKNDTVFVYSWNTDPSEEYVDVPWPKVHQTVGTEEIQWLEQQDLRDCQMIVERSECGRHCLYVEFYDQNLRREYAVRFAK